MNIKYTCKYFQNIPAVCVCLYIYIINIHSTHNTVHYINKKIYLDAINRLTAQKKKKTFPCLAIYYLYFMHNVHKTNNSSISISQNNDSYEPFLLNESFSNDWSL